MFEHTNGQRAIEFSRVNFKSDSSLTIPPKYRIDEQYKKNQNDNNIKICLRYNIIFRIIVMHNVTQKTPFLQI